MNTKQAGFTLIEVMVVVVIMGITASLLAPQYRRAVASGSVDNAIGSMRSIWDAQRAHLLEHGEYTDSMEVLEDEGWVDRIALNHDKEYTYKLIGSAYSFVVEASRKSPVWNGTLSLDEEGEVAGWLEDDNGARVDP